MNRLASQLLTKSSFTHFLDCPIRLWLEQVRKDLNPPHDAATELLFAHGRKVDDLARDLFPGGVVVEGYNLDGMKATHAAIARGARILYQPTAVGDGLSARADILVKGRNGWDIHEVKMGTKVDERESFHVSDVAFQRLAFEAAGIVIGKTFITHVDNTYVRDGEIDLTKLFVEEDVTREALKRTPEIEKLIPLATKVLAWPRELDVKHLRTCPNLQKCKYAAIWFETLTAGEREELAHELKLSEDTELFAVQKESIAAELAELTYPLTFYDYETYSDPIPPFDGYHPWQQIPFQFSATVFDKPGAKPRTFDFLADAFEDPSLAIIDALREAIPQTGTVVSWYSTFENTRNEELATLHPKFSAFLLGINERTFDLMQPFKKKLYVDPKFGGSASLKAVLPVMVPTLSYKKLAIQEGGTASASWPMLTDPNLPAAKRTKLRNDMIAFCQLDVLAMVKILERLQGL